MIFFYFLKRLFADRLLFWENLLKTLFNKFFLKFFSNVFHKKTN